MQNLHTKQEHLTLRKNSVNFYLLNVFCFCFNLNVRQAGQRRLFSGNLPAMFLLEVGIGKFGFSSNGSFGPIANSSSYFFVR